MNLELGSHFLCVRGGEREVAVYLGRKSSIAAGKGTKTVNKQFPFTGTVMK